MSMTPSFCGSVLRTLSTLSSTTYVKRGQDISNTVSQYLESKQMHKYDAKCTSQANWLRTRKMQSGQGKLIYIWGIITGTIVR